MHALIRNLQQQRVIAIDAFRGLTFLVMIVVNELAGVTNISPWFKHMPANADAMSFPDIVFPAFLFIVGMSIPMSVNQRLTKGDHKGDNFLQLNRHILLRAIGLIVMGLFMVNAESGYDAAAMPVSIHLWSLISYAGFAAIWGVYQFRSAALNTSIRLAGIITLIALMLIYRSDAANNSGMHVQWWGILGLIGWAYLFSSWMYQICRAKQSRLFIALALCTGIYMAAHSTYFAPLMHVDFLSSLLPGIDAHIAHSSIVLCGIICSLQFFEIHPKKTQAQRFVTALVLALCLSVIASLLRPYFTISKIYATPSWCFYSAAICIIVFALLYWLIDLRAQKTWVKLIQPVAINPLVCYLIPFSIQALLNLAGLTAPVQLFSGGAGIVAALIYTVIIVLLVAALNRVNFKLKF